MTNKLPRDFFPPFIGRDEDLTLAFLLSPDVGEIVDYLASQVSKQRHLVQGRQEWDQLEAQLTVAKKAIAADDLHRTGLAMFQIGQLIWEIASAHDHYDLLNKHLPILLYGAMSRMRQEQARTGNIRAKTQLKQCARMIAEREWENDTANNIRLGQMAKIVRKTLLGDSVLKDVRDTAQQYLPKNDKTLKDWLRPFAPDYASKSGAPRTPSS